MRFINRRLSLLKKSVLLASLAILTAFGIRSAAAQPSAADLPDRGLAPELTNTVWLNAEKPLRLADFRGQVIMLEFWTINCINCFHTQPYLRDIYARLNGKGIQVISVHYPEFSYEQDANTVNAYLKENGIHYPVAIDNDGASWNAYEMHAWPALELIDKNGHRRFRLIGEGGDTAIEAAIQSLLAEPGPTPPATNLQLPFHIFF